jgi:hypothetical protein
MVQQLDGWNVVPRLFCAGGDVLDDPQEPSSAVTCLYRVELEEEVCNVRPQRAFGQNGGGQLSRCSFAARC